MEGVDLAGIEVCSMLVNLSQFFMYSTYCSISLSVVGIR